MMSDAFKRLINVLVFGLLTWSGLLIPIFLYEYSHEINIAEKRFDAFDFERKLWANDKPKYQQYHELHVELSRHMDDSLFLKRLDAIMGNEKAIKKAQKEERFFHFRNSYELRLKMEEKNKPELNEIALPILNEMRSLERSEIKKVAWRDPFGNLLAQIGLILLFGILILIFNYVIYGKLILFHKQKK